MLTMKKIPPILLCILLFFSNMEAVWPRSIEKQAVLAVLTLNVARFTSWPEQIFNTAEVILNLCVFGDNVVQDAFEKIDQKVVNNKTIHIINLSRLRNVDRCQLLYLSELDQSRLVLLLAEIQGKAVLTVGENMNFLRAGGMVGLEKVEGKIRLSINLAEVKQAELVISSRLLKLAKIVNFPKPTQKTP